MYKTNAIKNKWSMAMKLAAAVKHTVVMLGALALVGCVPLVGTLEAGVESSPVPVEGTKPPAQAATEPVTTPPNPLQVDLSSLGNPPEGMVAGGFGADFVWQVGENGALGVLPSAGDVNLSPDGRQSAYAAEGDIWLYDFASQQTRNLTQTPDRVENAPQWWPARPDLLVFLSWPSQAESLGSAGMLSTINLDGSDYRVLDSNSSSSEPALSPDGQWLAYDLVSTAWLYKVGENRALFDMALFGLNLDMALNGTTLRISSPAWSPDGSQLAWWVNGIFPGATEPRMALVLFDLTNRTHRMLHPYAPISLEGPLSAPAWSPDGQWLALETRGEQHRTDLWAVRADGSQEIALGWASSPVWQPRGEALGFVQWGDEQGAFDSAQIAYVEPGQWVTRLLDMPRDYQLVDWRAPLPMLAQSAPGFAPQVWFGLQPAILSARQSYPAGTMQVYALWSYSGMSSGMTIKSTLYKDGVIWQEQEFGWDETRYGRAGIMRDFLLGSADKPLESGNYQLSLAIDGEEQMQAETLPGFTIAASAGLEPLASPDGRWLAVVVLPSRLVVQDGSGIEREVEANAEISGMAWMPDNQHLLYNIRDRSGQYSGDSLAGVLDSLWLVNVVTGEKRELAVKEEAMHSPVVSPDGTYVALIGGTGWQVDCFIAREFWVIQLDAQMARVYNYYQLDFQGLPDPGTAYVEKIIGWQSPTLVAVAFKWACSDGANDGVYLLDLVQRTASKQNP